MYVFSPKASLRPLDVKSLCGTCGTRCFFDTKVCGNCAAASVFTDKSLQDKFADNSVFGGELQLNDHSVRVGTMHTLEEATQGRVKGMSLKSWASNMAKDMGMSPGGKLEYNEAVVREALYSILLTMQQDTDEIKGSLRKARAEQSNVLAKRKAVLAAFHEHLMFRSPLSFVTTTDKAMANAIFKTTINKSQELCDNAPERYKIWTTFLSTIPLNYRSPINTCLMGTWRESILLYPDGTVRAAATPLDFVANLINSDAVPVLDTLTYKDWMLIDSDLCAMHMQQQAQAIAIFTGVSFKAPRSGKAAWKGSTSTLTAISLSDSDSDSDNSHALTASTTRGTAGDVAIKIEKDLPSAGGRPKVDICIRNGKQWRRHSAITGKNDNVNGWWRVLDDGELPIKDQPVFKMGKVTIVKWTGHYTKASEQPDVAVSTGNDESKASKSDDTRESTLTHRQQQQELERVRKQNAFLLARLEESRGTRLRGRSSKRRQARLRSKKKRGTRDHDDDRTESSSTEDQDDDRQPASAVGTPNQSDDDDREAQMKGTPRKRVPWNKRRKIRGVVRKQRPEAVKMINETAPPTTDSERFIEFVQRSNIYGLKVRQKFEVPDSNGEYSKHRHEYFNGFISSCATTNGNTTWTAFFPIDNDTQEYDYVTMVNCRALHVRNHAAAKQRGHQRHKRASGTSARERATPELAASASDTKQSAWTSDDELINTCVAGCGAVVAVRGGKCSKCPGGYCKKADCDRSVYDDEDFCSMLCESTYAPTTPRLKRRTNPHQQQRTRAPRATGAPLLHHVRLSGGPMRHVACEYDEIDLNDLINVQLERGSEYSKYADELRHQSMEPVEALLQIGYTLVSAEGRHEYKLTEKTKDEIRRRQRQAPSASSLSAETSVVFELSHGANKDYKRRIKLPTEFPEIFSKHRLDEVFGTIADCCVHGARSAQDRMQRAPSSEAHDAAASDRDTWLRKQKAFNAIYSATCHDLDDAKHELSAQARRESTERVWAYLQYVLYIARVTRNHALICTGGRHEWLWSQARKGGFIKRSRAKELRDPQREAFANSVAAYGKTSATRSGGARAPQRQGTRRDAKDSRKRSRSTRVPDDVMANAPPTLYKVMEGRCLACGSTSHMMANCPTKNAATKTTEQKRVLARQKEKNQKVRDKRNAWIERRRR